MKAYIVKIAFKDIEPLIWRRVIMPADATFNRLHETIQCVTNFQSKLFPYHSFSVEIEDNFITNNEVIISDYKGKKYYGKTVKQPARIKIDTYLEKYNDFIYTYDFGDNWQIQVALEEIVEDYYFGYPTLLDGEGTAPPEDVGGPPGYESFLKVYNDPTHADYLSIYSWAEQQSYLPLDIVRVNDGLKYVKYKNTEWALIDHENYHVLSDKYRGEKNVDIDALPNKNGIIQYAAACTNLYGMIEHSKFLEIYNAQNKPSLTITELHALFKNSQFVEQLNKGFAYVQHEELIHESMTFDTDYVAFREETRGKPFYIPKKDELLRYVEDGYYEKTIHNEKLKKMIAKDFHGGSTLMIEEEIQDLVFNLQIHDQPIQHIIHSFLERFDFSDMKMVNDYMQAIMMIANNTRLWENRGHTPSELSQLDKQNLKPIPITPFSVIDGGKTGRNEPCPCGSGKKFKKCCGK